jgi:hypothetical protein
MQDFISQIKITIQRIKDCEREIPESQIKAKIITGLTKIYSHFVDSFFLLSDDRRSSINQIVKLLINQEFVHKQRQSTRIANLILDSQREDKN